MIVRVGSHAAPGQCVKPRAIVRGASVKPVACGAKVAPLIGSALLC
jgi:hypothetical protein